MVSYIKIILFLHKKFYCFNGNRQKNVCVYIKNAYIRYISLFFYKDRTLFILLKPKTTLSINEAAFCFYYTHIPKRGRSYFVSQRLKNKGYGR